MLRVAVVGLGRMGARHVEAFRALGDACVVTAGFDVAPRRSGRRGAPTTPRARSLDEAIDGADLVVVATPSGAHVDVALRAITAGRHVLVEKPLARTVADAQRLIDCARDRGVELIVALSERFNPAVGRLRAHLAVTGEDVLALEMDRHGPPPRHTAGVDILTELAIHDVDLATWLVRSPIAALSARIAHTGRGEDAASLELTAANGVRAHINVSWREALRRRRLVAHTSRGTVVVDLVSGVLEGDGFGREPVRGPSPLVAQASSVMALLTGLPNLSGLAGLSGRTGLTGAGLRDDTLICGAAALPVLASLETARAAACSGEAARALVPRTARAASAATAAVLRGLPARAAAGET